jgi:hypothetical protein
LVVEAYPEPGGLHIYRFIHNYNTGKLIFLRKYSSEDFIVLSHFKATYPGDRVMNKKSFNDPSMESIGDNSLIISSLEYPGTIPSQGGNQLKKEDEYPFAYGYGSFNSDTQKYEDGFYQGAFFHPEMLKFAFVDTMYGDVYTTDTSKIQTGDDVVQNVYGENGFYIKAPDGTFVVYSQVIDLGGSVPNITWNNQVKNDSKYSYKSETGCGTANYANDVSATVTDDNLIPLGKTVNDAVVYGYKNADDKVLKDFYREYKNFVQQGMTPVYYSDAPGNLTYEQFLQTHPIFFWKDSSGRTIQFINLHYVYSGGCGKPVIYLYPEKTQNVSVQVTPTGGMTVSDPAYNGGWNVVADTQSNLLNLADQKTYPYLFWEGSGDSIYHMPERGFVVAKENIGSFFDEKLSQSGLIVKEIADFKEFWVPKMASENKPYYFVTFVDRKTIDTLAPLTITPKPDTVIRVLMDYKALDAPINVQGFDIKTPKRTGFVATEWGGVLK